MAQCSNPKTLFITLDYQFIYKNIDYFSIIDIDTNKYIGFLPAPCRNCFNCKQNRINFWNGKLNSELYESKYGIFVTLTFDDEHLKEFSKETYQKYLKRLRKVGLKFKYFIVAELGKNTLRPHFHCIFFGLEYSKEYNKILDDKWNCGFTKLEPLDQRHFGYLVNYLFKQNLFLSYSKKLGYGYFDKCKDDLQFSLNGYKHNFSYYYSKNFLSEEQQLLREDKLQQYFREEEERLKLKYGENWKHILYLSLKQKNIDLRKLFELKNMI